MKERREKESADEEWRERKERKHDRTTGNNVNANTLARLSFKHRDRMPGELRLSICSHSVLYLLSFSVRPSPPIPVNHFQTISPQATSTSTSVTPIEELYSFVHHSIHSMVHLFIYQYGLRVFGGKGCGVKELTAIRELLPHNSLHSFGGESLCPLNSLQFWTLNLCPLPSGCPCSLSKYSMSCGKCADIHTCSASLTFLLWKKGPSFSSSTKFVSFKRSSFSWFSAIFRRKRERERARER